MTTDQILKILRDTESTLTRRKQNALVRANWTRVIETEAQLDLLTTLRGEVMKLDGALTEAHDVQKLKPILT